MVCGNDVVVINDINENKILIPLNWDMTLLTFRQRHIPDERNPQLHAYKYLKTCKAKQNST
jgi:hypothetical protein